MSAVTPTVFPRQGAASEDVPRAWIFGVTPCILHGLRWRPPYLGGRVPTGARLVVRSEGFPRRDLPRAFPPGGAFGCPPG